MLIKNGTVYTVAGPEPLQADIAVENGVIKAIAPGLSPAPGEEVVDAAGLRVYPGFVDAHSHLALDGYGMGYDSIDYNEMGDILSPQLRGIDSFNPQDRSIEMARAGGVTTVGVGPGSANVLGGTFFAVKTYGSCVDDMILKDPVAMKCAFGENPKRCYRDKGNSARMSTAAKLREMLFAAQDYLRRREAAADDVQKQPKFDMKLEALIPVLKGEIPLKAHAHRADDICTAIRIAREFGVKMTLEHCTEGAPDPGDRSPLRLPGGRWPHAHTRQQIRACEQKLRNAGHSGARGLPGEHHHRFLGDPPAVSAPLRGPGRECRDGSVRGAQGHYHQPGPPSGRCRPRRLAGSGQGRRHRTGKRRRDGERYRHPRRIHQRQTGCRSRKITGKAPPAAPGELSFVLILLFLSQFSLVFFSGHAILKAGAAPCRQGSKIGK